MAIANEVVGMGTLISYESGFLGCIKDINWGGFERKAIESTCNNTALTAASDGFQTAGRTFFPGRLINNGQLELMIEFDQDLALPLNKGASSMSVTWTVPVGKTTGAVWSFSGFMIAASISAPLEELITAKVTIQVSGNITITPSS